jgi:hypothetical protein
MTLLVPQNSATNIPVDFIGSEIRPSPIRIGQPRTSRRRIHRERKGRMPDGVEKNQAGELKS